MLSNFVVLVQIAFRNLFTSWVNLIIGGLILVGTLFVVVGGAMLDSLDSAMSRSIIGSETATIWGVSPTRRISAAAATGSALGTVIANFSPGWTGIHSWMK